MSKKPTTAEIKSTITKPEDRITVTVNNEQRELFMSAGLVRSLAAFIGDITAVDMIYSDPILQTAMLVHALTPRTERGAAADKAYALDDFEMTPDEAEKIVMWIGGHMLYFFINAALMLQSTVEKPVEALQSLMSSLTGSIPSQEIKPSVGPSASSQASSAA